MILQRTASGALRLSTASGRTLQFEPGEAEELRQALAELYEHPDLERVEVRAPFGVLRRKGEWRR